MPVAILFDLDDTLITWNTPPDEVWQEICRRYAAGLEGLFEAINKARDWYWGDPERHRRGRLNLFEARREVIRLAFSHLGLDSAALADRIADAYSADREETASLVPDATTTLEYLRGRGLRMALITNGGSEMQRAKIRKFGLEPFFDSILVEGEFGCGKPDNRVFHYTLEKLGVRAENTWMVGDDLERDIAPCRRLGIYAVWVDGKGTGLSTPGKARPDRIIRNISELRGPA
ncbi:MAG: hypothetical protein A2Z29_09775 [Chloroflexi bacterium RBG_16_56_11]|nr:MAG: hypothetical protein A2Z29_09775 [Chloroflexi bacterium RBG_16_56_11]